MVLKNKMKKIGIITIHNSPNYGASLQAFSLYEYIKQQGCDVELIDLHRPHYEDFVPSKKYKAYRTHVSKFSKIKQRVKRILHKNDKKKSFYNKEALPNFKELTSSIKMSRPFRGIDELYSNPPVYDLYITGSDQLWNPEQPFCLEPYFLTFAPQSAKKISYAASIGICNLTEKEKRDFKKWLSDYDAISVREKQAQKLLKEITGLEVKQVADPTFLLDVVYWRNQAITPKEKDYILLFTLQYMPEMLDFAQRLSAQSGKRLIVLDQKWPEDMSGNYMVVRDAGPTEWIGYIANAYMVLTNSFHGTVFSLIMGTSNFYTYIPATSSRGSRIVDLLDVFHLTDHILTNLNDNYDSLRNNAIGREYVSEILKEQQSKARQFLDVYIKD